MFAPPPVLETTVFARIPDRFRLRDRPSTWVDVQRGGAPTPCFLEGPSFDREGNLYVVDVPYGRVFRVSPGAEVELVAEYDGEPNGLKVHRDGRVFITDFRRGLMLLEPRSGRVTTLLERPDLNAFKGLNDLVFGSNGDLYFTDQGMTGLHDPTGRLYRLRADGRLEVLLDNVPSPNGLVLNREETLLYLAVTRGNCVWRVPLLASGGVTKVGVFVQLSGGLAGPDGLALDEQGNLAVAHVGFGTVWLFSPLGEPLYRVRSCAGLATTNLAYGGPDRRTLFITESETGSILTARLEVPGRPMYSHM
jgi:gluconolactonase